MDRVNSSQSNHVSRRDFLTAVGAAGTASILGVAGLAKAVEAPAQEQAAAEEQVVAKRPFGDSGVNVPVLSLGGMFDTINGQLLLRQAIAHGVTYWDTAEGYGESETGMGNFIGANSGLRESLFLVTKSGTDDPAQMTRSLEASLERLQTDYVDLFFMHGIDEPTQLTDAAKKWAGEMKSAGKIKLYGFSTHTNMSGCLAAAASMDWIDGIMLTYNYRVKTIDDANGGVLNAAIDACHQAGIGLTAMKTQGQGAERSGDLDADAAGELVAAFIDGGYTLEQAAVKWALQDERFASVCSQMPNMTLFNANLAAALNTTELTARQSAALRRYALATASCYCAGCSNLCRTAVADQVPINDVMRYLMYYNCYGEAREARRQFASLPARVRDRLASVDYSAAEAGCPQGLAIGQLMKQAAEVLG